MFSAQSTLLQFLDEAEKNEEKGGFTVKDVIK